MKKLSIKRVVNALEKILTTFVPAVLCGAPGIGKSAILAQVAKKLGWKFISCAPVTWDVTDAKGMPTVKDGVADFIPFGFLRQLKEANEPTLVLFDDFLQAPPAIQAALMPIFHQREIEGVKISDHVRIVAATNRPEDKAGVMGILSPLKDRCVILHLEPKFTEWRDWAFASGIHHYVTGFLTFRPKLLSKFYPSMDLSQSPSPRAWDHLSQLIHTAPDFATLSAFVDGTIGTEVGKEFKAFVKTMKSLPDVSAIAADPAGVPIPKEHEPETRYAVTTALAHFATKKNVDTFARFVQRLPSEFETLFYTLATKRDKALCRTDAFQGWQTRLETAKKSDSQVN